MYISPSIYPLFSKNYTAVKIKSRPTNSFCRNAVLLPFLLGKTFNVHNGRNFLRVMVSENIIGHKLGEFSQTRRRYYYKKGKKQKNKK